MEKCDARVILGLFLLTKDVYADGDKLYSPASASGLVFKVERVAREDIGSSEMGANLLYLACTSCYECVKMPEKVRQRSASKGPRRTTGDDVFSAFTISHVTKWTTHSRMR